MDECKEYKLDKETLVEWAIDHLHRSFMKKVVSLSFGGESKIEVEVIGKAICFQSKELDGDYDLELIEKEVVDEVYNRIAKSLFMNKYDVYKHFKPAVYFE